MQTIVFLVSLQELSILNIADNFVYNGAFDIER